MNPAFDTAAALSQVTAGIEGYNEVHNESRGTIRTLTSLMRDSWAQEQGIALPPQPDPRQAMNADYDALFSQSSRTLAQMGLDIRSSGERSPIQMVDRSHQTLSLAVIDCEQLARSLQGVSAEALQRPEVRKSFETLLRDLTGQFMATQEFFIKDGERKSLADGLPPVLTQLERLGVSTGNLALHIQRFEEGTLLEHTLADEYDLLSPPSQQGFGPATWHTDCSGARYEEHWRDALVTLARIGENEKAAEIYSMARANLRNSLVTAREQIELALESSRTEGIRLPGGMPADYAQRNCPDFLDVLERAASVLDGQLDVDDVFPGPVE